LAQDYIRHLRKLALNGWRPERPPRPALGYVGFGEVAGESAGDNRDSFIEEFLRTGRFFVVDQTDWLFSHSGMRIPSDEVFERSYVDAIMNRILKEGAGFGRY
jgi:hypothetical protein